MNSIQKNQTITVSREELPNLMLSTLSEAVDAWGDKEKLLAISEKMKDLGVAWENFKSNEEATHIMIFEGVGSGLSEEGKVFASLSDSIESGDQPAFAASVTAIKSEISVKEDAEPEDDEEKEEPELKPEEKPVVEEPSDEPEKPKEEPVEEVPEPATEETIVEQPQEQPIEATNPEVPAVEVQTEKWGTDLAAELAEKKKSEAKAKAAKEELILKEKAASFKPDTFSWDKVNRGKFQG